MKKTLLFLILCSSIFVSCSNDSADETQQAEYSGITKSASSGDASIIRDKETKSASLTIETRGKWRLFSGPSVDRINLLEPVAEGVGSGTFALNVSNSVRSYFKLVTPKSKVILAERHLPMAGAYNFRDLGGFRTAEGRYVKWGKLLRADELGYLTDADLNYLSSVPVTSVVDFRSQGEITETPNRIPASVQASYQYPLTSGDFDITELIGLTPAQLDTVMMNMNISLITNTAYIEEFKKFFVLLQNETNLPLLYHCSAGKDRTGMATALILFSLGVDEDTIIEDYLASNIYLSDKYEDYINNYPSLRPLFELKAEFLKAGINKIKEDYGTVQSYLVEVLDVDIRKMKRLYLY